MGVLATVNVGKWLYRMTDVVPTCTLVAGVPAKVIPKR